MAVGIVDLGTNSVRFAIYDENGAIPLCLYKRKLMLRPGEGVFETGRMKRSNLKRLASAFSKFSRRCATFHCSEVLAVATSAMREAKNSRELIRKVKRQSGIHIRVITGQMEAQLIARGIFAYEPPPWRSGLLIDIGGGSTELNEISKGQLKKSVSLPLGAYRLRQIFLRHPFQRELGPRLLEISEMRQHIQQILATEFQPNQHLSRGLGSSGTIRAVARLIHPRRSKKRATVRRKLSFTSRDLRRLVERIELLSRKDLRKIPGMEKRRLEIIVTGSILLLEIMDFFGIERISTSSSGLRDGLLAWALEK